MSSDSSANAPAFDLEKVNFDYPGGENALRDIDLSIGQGERIVLLGANGSGKSTLLKVLNGLVFPQQGEVRAFGQPLDEAHLNNDAFNHWFRRQGGFLANRRTTQTSSEASPFPPTFRKSSPPFLMCSTISGG